MSLWNRIKNSIIRRKFRRHVASLNQPQAVVDPEIINNPISIDEVVPMLLAECSGIGPAWQEHLTDEYYDENGQIERLHYVDMSVVNEYFSNSLIRCQTEEFGALFNVAETVEKYGTEEAINLIGVGFIEFVMMDARDLGLSVDDFASWVGPKSKQTWLDLEQGWFGPKEESKKEQKQ